MSEFEFVSVAVALLYSIALGRLLTSLPDLFRADRRYAVHAAWAIYLLVFSVNAWWALWNLRDFSFDPLSFLITLAVPAFVIVRVELLCGRPSLEITDYRAHFYSIRKPFFATGLASMSLIMILPLLHGLDFGAAEPRRVGMGLSALVVWVIGLATDRHRVHAVLVAYLTLLTFVGFLLSSVRIEG